MTIEACRARSYLGLGPKEDNHLYDLNPSSSYTRTTADFAKIAPRRCPYLTLEFVYKAELDDKPNPVELKKYRSYIDKEDPAIIHIGDYVRIRYENQWLSYYQNSEHRIEPYFESVTDSFQQMNFSHTIF